MKSSLRDEEIRWQVIKAMLDEFPVLKEKTKKYLGQAREQQQQHRAFRSGLQKEL